MVGGGIFSVLGLTVQIAGAGAYISFLVGGTVAALTGWSYARLSVLIRSRGGTATFLDRAFGTRIAGPLNLLLWLSYFVMLGLYAVAFGAYLAALLGLDPNGEWRRILGSMVIVCFAAFNLLGARVVGRGEAVLVYFKLAVLAAFVLGGLLEVDPSRIAPSAFPSFGVIVYAGTLIFLGYEGFELIANASEDARDPERTLPRAYLISIGSVIVLYVLVALVAVGNLTPATIASERDYVLAAAARPFLGSAGFKLIAVAAVDLNRQRHQCHPLRRRKVHLPDGARRRVARTARHADLEPPDRRSHRNHAGHARDRQHHRHQGDQLDGLGRLSDRLCGRQPGRRPTRRPHPRQPRLVTRRSCRLRGLARRTHRLRRHPHPRPTRRSSPGLLAAAPPSAKPSSDAIARPRPTNENAPRDRV